MLLCGIITTAVLLAWKQEYDVVLSTSSRLNLALHRLLRTILDRAEKTLDVGCLLPAGAEPNAPSCAGASCKMGVESYLSSLATQKSGFVN